MDLFILRHGIAALREDWAPKKESDRPLTRKGEKQVARIGKALRKAEFSFNVIATSPFARARKTAEIVAESLGLESSMKLLPSLKPQANPRQFLEEARDTFGTGERALVVGHEPFLTTLISLLVHGDTQTRLKLKKAGLCKIKVEALKPGGGVLEWLLTPKQVIAIGNQAP